MKDKKFLEKLDDFFWKHGETLAMIVCILFTLVGSLLGIIAAIAVIHKAF